MALSLCVFRKTVRFFFSPKINPDEALHFLQGLSFTKMEDRGINVVVGGARRRIAGNGGKSGIKYFLFVLSNTLMKKPFDRNEARNGLTVKILVNVLLSPIKKAKSQSDGSGSQLWNVSRI